MSTATASAWPRLGDRSWRDLTVRFAVGLAFADASIVVLALPQIVDELDTTISHVTWVIMAYNIALIVGVLGFLAARAAADSRATLLAGLALFGLASIGCGIAHNLELLVDHALRAGPWRRAAAVRVAAAARRSRPPR